MFLLLVSRICLICNPLSANPTKRSNTLNNCRLLPTKCLSVFVFFVGVAYKGLRSTQHKKVKELSLFLDLTPSFHVVFQAICFFSTTDNVAEIDCGSLEISQEIFYDGVSFSKVASLQCSDCNFVIKRTLHRFLFEN